MPLQSYEPQRFLREIRIAARLSHPQILPVHDSGECDGLLYFVMPYAGCETLRDRMQREGPLPIDVALRIARAVGAALSYAHRHNVIHRDIKPENILLQEGEPVVADFGVATAISAAAGESIYITDRGFAVGTPAYMSPEQASAERDLDGRSDLYSLACVLFEMLSGQPPFSGSGARATMARHAIEPAAFNQIAAAHRSSRCGARTHESPGQGPRGSLSGNGGLLRGTGDTRSGYDAGGIRARGPRDCRAPVRKRERRP